MERHEGSLEASVPPKKATWADRIVEIAHREAQTQGQEAEVP